MATISWSLYNFNVTSSKSERVKALKTPMMELKSKQSTMTTMKSKMTSTIQWKTKNFQNLNPELSQAEM
jgi:hypothetical protein